eukprot:5916927-Amphidinium_carterae.1
MEAEMFGSFMMFACGVLARSPAITDLKIPASTSGKTTNQTVPKQVVAKLINTKLTLICQAWILESVQ